MRIDILCKPGSGDRCERTLENVRNALDQSRIEAEVHLYQDLRKMIDLRVHVSPAVVIDDFVRVAGRVPDPEEILEMISSLPHYRRRDKS